MTNSELREILEEHQKWLSGEGGKKADLHGVDLKGVNLRGANLRGANLSGANLSGANLSRATLDGANLAYADLSRANLVYASLNIANLAYAVLSRANLSRTNLSAAKFYGAVLCGAELNEASLNYAIFQEADLHDANLQKAHLYNANFLCANLFGADLSYTSPHRACFYGADLRETKNVPFVPMACPDTGSFIAWKKASRYIVKLLIPKDAKRSSVTTRKCRANKAVVLAIENMDGTPSKELEVKSSYDPNFIYRVGEIVEVKDFCDDRFAECAPGIHFFINRDDAVFY